MLIKAHTISIDVVQISLEYSLSNTTTSHTTPLNANANILAAADRCVMCGLCLPHCPTYQLHHSESESPRGRIALMVALAKGELEATPALEKHLDSCLVCRACEKMCPSKVAYGELIDTTRTVLRSQGHTAPAVVTTLLEQVADPKKLNRNASLLRGYQKSGLQSLARASGLLKLAGLSHSEATLPTIPAAKPLPPITPAKGEQRGRIGLFTGCIGSVMESDVLHAAITLLSQLGYEVVVPTSQGCCGSLHQHNGDTQGANTLAKKNLNVFSERNLDAVVSTASGCAAQLADYEGQDKLPFYEICDFLSQVEWPDSLELKAQAQSALLHLPCSQRNVLNKPNAVASLLARIPQLKLEELAENNLCCGAGGAYQLSQPDNANALRDRKLDHIASSDAKLLVSNNLGCALHLQSGLQQRGLNVKVVHPVILLLRSLS